VGVGTRSVERAKAVMERDPELAAKVKAGDVTLKLAERTLAKAEAAEKIRTYVPPEGQYPVIVIDPPWPYEDDLSGSDGARGGLAYPTMTLEEICALKIPADEHCVLWLWITNAHLVASSHVRCLRAWRFEPKTIYTWDKVLMGVGRWGRNQTEHVILVVRGQPVFDGRSSGTYFREARRESSRKPEVFYEIVRETCPAEPKLEMFAREPRQGFVTAGAEKDLFPAPCQETPA
jgi:N6-adenosine-specific RNA methylase IME4